LHAPRLHSLKNDGDDDDNINGHQLSISKTTRQKRKRERKKERNAKRSRTHYSSSMMLGAFMNSGSMADSKTSNYHLHSMTPRQPLFINCFPRDYKAAAECKERKRERKTSCRERIEKYN
jgi:DNA-binding transcriptional regulator WhiA